jgi:hypothetical protein
MSSDAAGREDNESDDVDDGGRHGGPTALGYYVYVEDERCGPDVWELEDDRCGPDVEYERYDSDDASDDDEDLDMDSEDGVGKYLNTLCFLQTLTLELNTGPSNSPVKKRAKTTPCSAAESPSENTVSKLMPLNILLEVCF